MEYRDLLAADIAVELELLSPEAAAHGLAELTEADRARVEGEVDRLLADSKGDARLALARRGMNRKLHQSLAPETSHALVDSGTHVRVPLRTVDADRYVGFLPVGQGGMGVVYLALDTELNRKVAFKMVRGADKPLDEKPRTLPEETEARFLQEAWVTGGLEHPGIVPVYELGRTPSGIPYYTMRLVRGERTLEDAIKEARTAEERLALLEPFLKICDAMAYAHARSVIHRDLKPANIALGPFGEVVVLDWGLAKMHDRRDMTGTLWQARLDDLRLESKLETLTSSLGTPGYMAPEAALAQLSKVDERSDVYGLGAILYRILTGNLPVQFESYVEFVGAVREGVHEVPGAPAGLERICLKALAVKRADRYQDVDAMATDIRAWQTETAVDREAAGLMQEAEAGLEAAAALEGDALLRQVDRTIAVAMRVRGLRPDHEDANALLAKARARRTQAIEEHESAARRRLLKRVGVAGLITATAATVVVALMLNARRNEAEDARAQEAIARARADDERSRAEELARFMLVDLRDGLKPIGRLDLLGKVARKSLAYYESLPEAETSDAAWLARAVALANVGDVLVATGDLQGAESSLAASLKITRRLVERNPDYDDAQHLMAAGLTRVGNVERAKGNLDAVRAHYLEALALARAGARRYPAADRWQELLSVCLNGIGDVEAKTGNLAAALARYQDALAVANQSAARRPTDSLWQRRVSVCLDKIGNVQRSLGEAEKALTTFRQSLTIARGLAEQDPSNMAWQRDLSTSLNKAGEVERQLRDLEAASASFGEALSIARRLAERDPTNARWQDDLAKTLELAGKVEQLRGNDATAVKNYREALEINRRLTIRDPANNDWQHDLAGILMKIGDVAFGRDPGAAVTSYREAREITQLLTKRDPTRVAWQERLSIVLQKIGYAAGRTGDAKTALANQRASLEIMRNLAAADPSNGARQREVAQRLYMVGTTLQGMGKAAEATDVLKEALAVHANAVKLAPDLQREHAFWVQAHRLATLLSGERKPGNAEDHLEMAWAVYQQKDFREAARSFLKAFESEKIRGDLLRRNLYSAACAAAQVGDEQWQKQAIEWVREDVARRRAYITQMDAELAKGVDATRRAQLERALATLREHVRVARDVEPDFAALRLRPEFAKLFEE